MEKIDKKNISIKKSNGYTLVEMLVAGIVLFLVMISVTAIIINGSRFNREDMLRRRTFQVMEEFLESHRYGFYKYMLENDSTSNWNEDIDFDKYNPVSVSIYKKGSSEVNGTLKYAIRRERYEYGVPSDINYGYVPALSVHVEVKYQDKNEEKTETLSTIFTDVPIN